MTVSNIIRELRGNAPYRVVLASVERYNRDFLMNITIDSIWGVTVSAVQLDIKEADDFLFWGRRYKLI